MPIEIRKCPLKNKGFPERNQRMPREKSESAH